MNRVGRVAAAALFGLLCIVPGQAGAGVDEVEEAKVWLDRMNVAVEQLNYRGSFVHDVPGQGLETLAIVHRYSDGEVRERISSPDGSGREILRTARFVRSVFPDKHLVVIEEPETASLPTAAMLIHTEGLESYYELGTFREGQISGRETQVVVVRARDEYRYGYVLMLDRETALPLRSEVRDEKLNVVEQILFTEIEIVDAIDDEELAPAIDTTDFEIRRPNKNNNETASDENWAANWLPVGFTLSVYRSTLLAGSRYPVQHLVYSDGLATVSVFIAHPLSDADMPEGLSRMGTTNSYALKIDGRLAVAVGEVPPRTVHSIATSLDAR